MGRKWQLAHHDEPRHDEPRHDEAQRSDPRHDEPRHEEPLLYERPREGGRTGPESRVEERAPDKPAQLEKGSWWAVLRRTVKEFKDDELTDRAAALTYYGVLSLFPALLVLVAILGIAGESAINQILDDVKQVTPAAARDILTGAVENLRSSGGTSSILAIVGLFGALWSASGYVAAFIRTSNAVYDIPEGRPAWKVTPLRLAVTVVLMVLAIVSALIVVFTGGVAKQAGTALGLGDTVMTVWSIAKWPVLVLLVSFMIAILYRTSPNAKLRGLRWVTPGSLLALLIWIVASVGFALYVANFGSYNKTYGTLAGVIIFLLWLWLTNLAILLGLEFDAELARERAILGGHPAEEEPYVEPRDTRKWTDEERGG